MKTFVFTDFGFGDAGKGTICDWTCLRTEAHTVVRTGGPQAMHNVVTSLGSHHMFSQFGSGTLRGVKTHLSEHMVTDPYAIIAEGKALKEAHGIEDAFDRMTIDENALVVTPFQAVTNKLRELDRGPNRLSTVGIGVGETVLDSELLGDGAVRAKDLDQPWLLDKLEAICQLKLSQLDHIIDRIDELPEQARQQVEILQNPQIVEWATEEFGLLSRLVAIVDGAYLGEILAESGVVIFEPSQGVLLDRWHGFHPYTTKVNPTSSDAIALLEEHDYQGEVVRLGIIRAYQTRHGAGPFVTESEFLSGVISDAYNNDHEWQGSLRVGQLDAVATRYAINVCGGPTVFDGLVVTCLDQMVGLTPWQICDSYRYQSDESGLDQFFMIRDGRIIGIRVRSNSRDETQLGHQERLGQLLRQCSPEFTNFHVPKEPEDRTYEAYLHMINERLEIPIVATSYGPTERDKKALLPTLFADN